jgi:hypothetical protein
MIPPILAAHFEKLKARYGGALLQMFGSGAALVTVPACALPAGWSAPQVTLRFVAPNGYPVSAPDSFWVEPNLSIGGGLPRNSQLNYAIPEAGVAAHWFSWHIEQGQWSPNNHDLLTWLGLCLRRLQKPE